MQFQVPQFIGRESTITVGLTFKQFIFLGIAGGAILVLFFIFKKNLFLLIINAIPIITFTVILAFGRVQGIPFATVSQNLIFYLLKPRTYTWKRKGISNSPVAVQPKIVISQPQPQEQQDKIKIGVTKEGQLGKLHKRIETI